MGDGVDGTTETHKNRKREEYWADLVGGGTAAYKMGVLERLLEGGPPAPGGDILDVGAGDLARQLIEANGRDDDCRPSA